jgi:hypothetical protein
MGGIHWGAAACCALLGSAGAAQEQTAERIREPKTGVSFSSEMTVGGDQFDCLGAGLRRVFVVNAYALAFCADDGGALVDEYTAQRYPGLGGEALEQRLAKDPAFFEAISEAPGDKVVVMRVLRDLPAERLREAFRESLANVLPPEKVDKLLTVLTTDARKGELAVLRSDGERVVVDIGGRQQVVDDADIAQKLWTVWLGPKSVTPSLKESIAERAARSRRLSAR